MSRSVAPKSAPVSRKRPVAPSNPTQNIIESIPKNMRSEAHAVVIGSGVVGCSVLYGTQVGVFFLDIDNFKYINDSMGHAFGDRVLVSLARRLQATTESFGFAARLGGDEFTVVFDRVQTNDDIRAVGMNIVQAFQKPLTVDNRDLIVSVSVGASIYPEHAKDADALLKAADAASFRAKVMGRSQLSVFTPELLQAAAAKFTTEQGLRRAIVKRRQNDTQRKEK